MSNSWAQNAKRVLAVRLDNMGDVVLLTPALRTLREAMPQADLTLMVTPTSAQVTPLLPWVDRVFPHRPLWQDTAGTYPFDPEAQLRLVAALRYEQFDVAFIFTSFSQSPYPPAFACYLAGVPVRIGQSQEFGGGVLSHWIRPPDESTHQAERNLHLLEEIGLPVRDRRLWLDVPEQAATHARALLQTAGVQETEPYAVLAPFASCQARSYPPERAGKTARLVARETGLPVVLVGAPKDAVGAEKAMRHAGHAAVVPVVNVTGETTVTSLAALVWASALVVTANSVCLHFAEALGRPVVALYSGTDLESQWRSRFAPSRILREPTWCSPCYAFDCPYELQCLNISPERVAEAAVELLAEVSPRQTRKAVAP